ncbi:MAG: mechanosensitive ion channel family protein [Planctomycetota bacterium]|jgi:small-conductance mechanosensitive channel
MAQEEAAGAADQLERIIDSVAENWETWAWALLTLVIAVIVALVLHLLLFALLAPLTRKTSSGIDDIFLKRLKGPTRLLLPILAIQLVLPYLDLPPGALEFIRHMNSIVLIGTVIWLLVAVVGGVERIILARYEIDTKDNRLARRMHTQLRIISRTLIWVVLIIGLATLLMTFPKVRQLGTSLLASAGIAGLILGLASRPFLENLIAGLQLAFSAPVNLDDVVIIEGEWGRIEEITTTYVVVGIWDQRRLIVPFSWILQKPFQNWTRQTADILGTVNVHTDYTVPVQAVREELERIAKESEYWDGRVCGLQVTEAMADTVVLRALVSAADSSKAWNLRCEVREKLIRFLQKECPTSLPRVRAEIQKEEVPLKASD